MDVSTMAFVSVDYKVFGLVQGVFFRKFTREAAIKYGLVGWVRNERDETVTGVVQGPADKVSMMKMWLEKEGSPHCKITKCEFSNERRIERLDFTKFTIQK